MKIQFIAFLFFVILSSNSFGFNSKKCVDLYIDMPKGKSGTKKVTAPFFITSFIPTFSSSVSSYFSSTGKCSASASLKGRERFVAKNINIFKIESATGEGEFLNTLAFLEGCPENLYDDFSVILKQNYEVIFKNKKGVYHRILKTIRTSKKLNQSCNQLANRT